MQTEDQNDTDVNLPELLARVEFDRELLREVFQIFTEEFPAIHSHLKQAIASGDHRRTLANAHTMKGMCASLSFSKARASALRIEQLAEQSAVEKLPIELAILERDVILAQASLERICKEAVR